MPIPQSARFGLFLRRLFTIRETMGDINVLQDLFPTAEVAGDIMPDLRRFRDEKGFIISAFSTQANLVPRMRFLNFTPNSISVIRHLLISSNISDNIQLAWSATVGAFDHSGGQTDGRESRGTISASQLKAQNNLSGAVANPFVSSYPIANNVGTPLFLPNVDLVLTNADPSGVLKGLEISGTGTAASYTLAALAWGYERAIEPHEQQFS